MKIEVKRSRDTTRMRIGDWLRLGRLSLRRKLLIGLLTLCGLLAGTGLALVHQESYQASTEIIVRPQHIPQDFIKSTVRQDLALVVKTLSQQIMSRSRLQKIIEEFDLYPEIRQKEGMLQAIEAMRSAIHVENWSSDSFKISFTGHDPVVVRDVTNTLASLFIQENLRHREEDAQTITEYLEKELISAQAELEQVEAEIRRFQEENMGTLPSQEQAIAGRMSRLMSQYQTLSEQIRAAQNRKLILAGQMRDEETRPATDTDILPARVELARARKQLEVLRRTFTDQHPDVIAAKEAIRQLRRQVRSEGGYSGAASASLRAEMRSTEREIEALQAERAELQQQLGMQQEKIGKIPKVAEQFASLQRRYEFAQETYNDLRNKAEEARRSQQMEERQKGEQFEIVDKAVIPNAPRHPRKHELVLAGLVFGFGLGFGTSFVRTFFDPTFRVRNDLVDAVGLPVLSSIPRIEEGRSA